MHNLAELRKGIELLQEKLGFPTDPVLADALGVSVRTYYTVRDSCRASEKTLRIIASHLRKHGAIGADADDAPNLLVLNERRHEYGREKVTLESAMKDLRQLQVKAHELESGLAAACKKLEHLNQEGER